MTLLETLNARLVDESSRADQIAAPAGSDDLDALLIDGLTGITFVDIEEAEDVTISDNPLYTNPQYYSQCQATASAEPAPSPAIR